ncbi:MAG TPA: efflux transporter outer membrane subunit [Steroidobacteraceae bacterium]|nr:efflux transporter outer membrane subunit [Steroidobacteraceae bacterium]
MRRRLAHCARGLWGASLTLLSACAVGPNYHRPDEHVPDHYAAMTAPAIPDKAGETPVAQPVDVDMARWWKALHDAELESLVDRAIRANPDLQIALDRLQAARTYEIALIGSVLPDAQASAGAGRGTGSDLTRGRTAQSLISADNSSGLQHINEVAGFDSVWELDIFGKYRREMQAARYDVKASLAQRNAVLVSVVADVVRAYIDLRGLQMRASVLHASIETLQESLRIVKIRYERGITNELDVTLATRELATLQAQVAPVDAQVKAAQYTIATLLGEYPEALVAELTTPTLIPSAPAAVHSELPVQLLRRRPEIMEAEGQLAAATARIGVATANLFPQIAITGAIGFQRQGLGTTPLLGEHIWSLGPGAVWPLLDFGLLDSQVETADLQTRALLVNYKRTIQNAVKDVDTAWSAYAAQQVRLGRLGEALVASQRAVTLATERYERGLTDFLNVIDAQRQNYDIEEQYTDAQVGVAEEFVALYRSFGGGWEDYQSLPPAHIPEPAIIAAFHRVLAHNDPLKQ